MSSGNTTTEFTRQEMAMEAAVIHDQAMAANGLLRRALARLAHKYIELQAERRPGLLATPDAGVAVMLCAVMDAHDEMVWGGGE